MTCFRFLGGSILICMGIVLLSYACFVSFFVYDKLQVEIQSLDQERRHLHQFVSIFLVQDRRKDVPAQSAVTTRTTRSARLTTPLNKGNTYKANEDPEHVNKIRPLTYHALLWGNLYRKLSASSSLPKIKSYGEHSAKCSSISQISPGCFSAAWVTGLESLLPNCRIWIQVDFGFDNEVVKVVTRGRGLNSAHYETAIFRHHYQQWVEEFTIWYKSLPSQEFESYKINKSLVEFAGNTDRHTIERHALNPSIIARYVRLYPTKCHRICSLRWE